MADHPADYTELRSGAVWFREAFEPLRACLQNNERMEITALDAMLQDPHLLEACTTFFQHLIDACNASQTAISFRGDINVKILLAAYVFTLTDHDAPLQPEHGCMAVKLTAQYRAAIHDNKQDILAASSPWLTALHNVVDTLVDANPDPAGSIHDVVGPLQVYLINFKSWKMNEEVIRSDYLRAVQLMIQQVVNHAHATSSPRWQRWEQLAVKCTTALQAVTTPPPAAVATHATGAQVRVYCPVAQPT